MSRTRKAQRFCWSLATLTIWASAAHSEPVRFAEISREWGLDFKHTHGGSGELYYVETMGSGGGVLDFDGDGDLDVYLVNGAPLPGYQAAETPTNRLYRNDGVHFVESTSTAEVGDTGYGMGCAAADYDNDGDQDLYLTNFGANVLYRNDGVRFVESTSAAGVGDSLWSTSATWIDYDRDGLLDLYVVNYTDFDLDKHRLCLDRGLQVYCDPAKFAGVADRLYHNEGGGQFTDVSLEAGLGQIAAGKGLGVAGTDYDRDGDLDLYVANDKTPNHLLRNEGDGRFTEVALLSGVSHNGGGELEASMGVDFGDFDGDGFPDLYVSNFSYETYTLYHNLGNGFFTDVTAAVGLSGATLRPLGFGARFFDYDNDGDLDLFNANGHVLHNIELLENTLTYGQENQLLENERGRFVDISTRAGPAFKTARVSRGAAFGDIDNDGDVDILVTNCNGRPELLRNDSATGHHWLALRAIGSASNRDGIGARIELWANGRRQVREVSSGSSYLSVSDSRVHFGLGESRRVDRLQVYWPSGKVDQWEELDVDRFTTLREGESP